jgi:hypothetical protein
MTGILDCPDFIANIPPSLVSPGTIGSLLKKALRTRGVISNGFNIASGFGNSTSWIFTPAVAPRSKFIAP